MLAKAVIIAGDGSSADICLGSDRGVTKIGEMVGLGTSTKRRLLDLDKIADLHAVATFGAGTKSCIRADDTARPKPRAFEM